ncbi:TPA: hypothetical protein DEP21_01770 [Patescibacteria group bacterium]|nr:hypothetical protein [Candidatus Gracilibacteria bacterium]
MHPGHIECFELCKTLGDELRVIVNNDYQIKIKTKNEEPFQDEQFRLKIVDSLKVVDLAILSVDKDGSVCESIKDISNIIRDQYGPDTNIIFGK